MINDTVLTYFQQCPMSIQPQHNISVSALADVHSISEQQNNIYAAVTLPNMKIL